MKHSSTQLTKKGTISIVNHLPKIESNGPRNEIIEGLTSSPKYISSKYFYDERGSELFEAITQLDEYYPTRCEKSILSTIGNVLNLDFSGLSIIELGSGDHSKIQLLLQQIPENELSTITYFPVDISQSAIEKASEHLASEFPMIHINGIVADFLHHLNMMPRPGKRLFCFFGSTIGNLTKTELQEFMMLLGAEMQAGDSLLLGMDMIKDRAIMERAYNDEQQITADFNKNILSVVNALAGTNFDPSEFEHMAFYNEEKMRIEMHLKATKDTVIHVNSETDDIRIKKGETIHAENSHKFSKDDIETIGFWAELNVEAIFTDNHQWFSLVHYRKN